MFHSENENFEILLDSLLVLDRDFLLDDTLEQFLSCFASVLARNPPVLLGRIEDELKELAERENCVIVGRCADYVLRKAENKISIFKWRIVDQIVKL